MTQNQILVMIVLLKSSMWVLFLMGSPLCIELEDGVTGSVRLIEACF